MDLERPILGPQNLRTVARKVAALETLDGFDVFVGGAIIKAYWGAVYKYIDNLTLVDHPPSRYGVYAPSYTPVLVYDRPSNAWYRSRFIAPNELNIAIDQICDVVEQVHGVQIMPVSNVFLDHVILYGVPEAVRRQMAHRMPRGLR